MDEQSIWMQMCTDARREIVQRQLLFVALESLLFIGFATLLINTGSSCLYKAIAILGLLSSFIGFFHTKEPAGWLENLRKNIPEEIRPLYEKVYEQQTKLERLITKLGKKLGSRWVSFHYPLFFLVLWLLAVLYSFRILGGA